MGTSRRYAESIDRQMSQRIEDIVMRDETPTSLTDQELELDRLPLTKTPKPHPVRAWVRYGATAIRVEGQAVAWTPRAMAVEWRTPAGRVHRAWVWASAVEQLAELRSGDGGR